MTRQLWWLGLAAIGCGAPNTPIGGDEPVAVSAQPSRPAIPERAWRPLTHVAPFPAAAPQLLTDGTVMIQQESSEHWFRLTPDAFGSYADGTWSQLGALPIGYSPLYYASGLLPDGRLIIMGGEYIAGQQAFSKRGAIYDPVADIWTEQAPPAGWTTIGDASGMVLANGTFMLSDCCSKNLALYEPTARAWLPTGEGKQDIHDEESWALLPDGDVLTIDCNNVLDLAHAERYHPATGRWGSGGTTPIQISDYQPDGSGSHEVGPEILQHDGSVLALGGNGHNVRFATDTQTWSTLPDLPVMPEGQLDLADGPAAIMPNGNVLIGASPGVFNPPMYFLEWNGSTFTETAKAPHADVNTSYQHFMLMLPSGEVMMTDFSDDIELYTPAAGIDPRAVPVITHVPTLLTSARATGNTAPEPLPADAADLPVTTLYAGDSYVLTGKRLSGITQGAYYGDDQQSHTNYPIVRLTHQGTGHVTYCRSYDRSTSSIAPDARGTTKFDIPATAEPGLSTLEVVANGIPSPPVLVNVR